MRTTLALFAVATLLSPHILHGQADLMPYHNAIYVEVWGNGGLFSINYERRVAGLGVRVGVASWGSEGESVVESSWSENFVTFPLTVSRLPRSRPTGWETGAGLLLGQKKRKDTEPGLSDFESTPIVDLTGILGYRWVRQSGWMFRATFTPFLTLVGDYPTTGIFPSAGLSAGRAF